MTADAFHYKADDISEILIHIKAESGNVFGGYTSVAWSSTNEQLEDSKAFLFTLINDDNLPAKLDIKNISYAIHDAGWSGPRLGKNDNVDLRVSYDRPSFIAPGKAYETFNGYECTEGGERIAGNGNRFFNLVEFEIFKVYNFDSAILSDSDKTALKKLLSFESKGFSLRYRATTDGFAVSNFHSKCDGLTKTLLVIKSRHGNVFGGYTAAAWQSSNPSELVYDPTAFLFSLINDINMPAKLPIYKNGDYAAIENFISWGPTFGGTNGGHDFHLRSNPNTEQQSKGGHINLGMNYERLRGLDSSNSAKVITGDTGTLFYAEDIEIFQIY